MTKYAISILGLVLPLMSSAATKNEVSAGSYSDCVKWTTVNGVEHSKGFQYVLNEDDSMSLDVFYYTGSARCEGSGEVLMHAENFSVQKKIAHGKKIFSLLAKNEDKGDYYQMMFSEGRVLIHVSDSLPFEYDINRSLLLTKTQVSE